eukprot:503833_1
MIFNCLTSDYPIQTNLFVLIGESSSPSDFTLNISRTAPNNGRLQIDISNNIQFTQNNIYNLNTNDIIINCNGDCSDNIIDGFESNLLNIICDDSSTTCDNNDIKCPNECNILCRDCSDTLIITSSLIDSINWPCSVLTIHVKKKWRSQRNVLEQHRSWNCKIVILKTDIAFNFNIK